jgi:hypothetical protein
VRDEEIARECHGVTLDPLNPQTEYSYALLELFKHVLQGEAYVERLKRHYKLFKFDLSEDHRLAAQPRKKAKRKRQ